MHPNNLAHKAVIILIGFMLSSTLLHTSYAAMDNTSNNGIDSLVSGHYVVKYISASVNNFEGKRLEQLEKRFQKLKEEIYFYYNAQERKLTFNSAEKVVTKPIEFDENSRMYETTAVTELGIIRIDKEPPAKIVSKDATHFQLHIKEEFFNVNATIDMVCERVEEDHPQFLAVCKKLAEKDKDISAYYADMKKEITSIEFVDTVGFTRECPFITIRLPISEKLIPLAPSFHDYIFSKFWKSSIVNNDTNFKARYGTERVEILIAVFEGPENLFCWKTEIAEQTYRPDQVVLQEENGIIFYESLSDNYVAEFHYYDPKNKMHIVGRTIPNVKTSLDTTLSNYKFLRTLDPANRTGKSTGVDFAKLFDTPIEQIEKDFQEQYTCKVFLSDKAVSKMIKHSTKLERLLSKQAGKYTVYSTDHSDSSEYNPYKDKMVVRFSLDSIADVKKELESDGWKIVFQKGSCLLRAHVNDKVVLSGHYLYRQNGLTVDIAYEPSNRSPLAAVHFLQQIRDISPPPIPFYSLPVLEKMFARYDNVKTFPKRDGVFVVGDNKKEGIIRYDGTVILPLEYKWIRTESCGYSANPHDDFGTTMYFDYQGNKIP
ncbi:hypothetical protein [Halodesulfovibrio aestuarii]|uniref:hypothetical protein n=1 Tax=Halodesulfovibrio aestuarii TaxID=126333 RepID=UPI0004227D98